MNQYLLIGVIAGACTALLNLSGYAGGAFGLGVILVLLSPLPIMIAALGWGSFTGLVAAIASALVSAILIGPLAGFLFFLLNSLPAWWLTHLLGLNRTDEETGEIHWYPLDRLLLWIAGIAALTTMAMFIPFGFSLDEYRDAISTLMQQAYGENAFRGPDGSGLSLENIVAIVSRMAPTASAAMIVISSAINLYLAGKITQKSGHLTRPWPNLHQLSIRPVGAYIFMFSLIALFLLGGLPGVFAQTVASGFGTVLLLVGLSVLHFITRSSPSRVALLWGTYFLLVVFLWIGVVLVMLGTAEVLVNVRSRIAAGKNPPPRTPDGSNE